MVVFLLYQPWVEVSAVPLKTGFRLRHLAFTMAKSA
jgi:hypothetical protein